MIFTQRMLPFLPRKRLTSNSIYHVTGEWLGSIRNRSVRTFHRSSIPYTGSLNCSVVAVNNTCCCQCHYLQLSPPVFSQTSRINQLQTRGYRSGRSPRESKGGGNDLWPQKSTPELMNFPWIIWPSIWYTIRNWIFANLIIRPYLDREFTLGSFKDGSIKALVHVSNELSKGNFGSLEEEGLMTKLSLEEIRRNFSRFSQKQRHDLAVEREDIIFSFPYQIGVMFHNEGTANERIFVEITVCYHVFRGFKEYVEDVSKNSSSHTGGIYNNQDRIFVANYRFIREFTRGVEDQWVINVANHFKPGDHIQVR